MVEDWQRQLRHSDFEEERSTEGGRWIVEKDECDEVEKAECRKEWCVRCHFVCVFMCVAEPLSLLVLRVCLFSRARLLSISLSFNSPPFFVCLSLSRSVSLPSNPLPPGLVEQWADMSLFLCKSNWRQAFIGMTWRGVAKSFQPSCLRLVPLSSRTVLYTDAAAAATEAGLNGFKSCNNP